VLQDNVETIALEQTVLAGGDDFAAQVFLEKGSGLGYVGSGKAQVVELRFFVKIHDGARRIR
jgi:hypothetical protein